MSNESMQSETLKTWWQQTDFKGKEFCDLKDNGELVLKKSSLQPERVITTLTPDNIDAAIHALIEKYPEVESRIKDFKIEWEAAPDPLKLIGKVFRLRDYLLHTNAIGDFESLLQQVQEWERSLHALIENNFIEKSRLVEKAEKLATESESWKDTTQALKEINDRWKTIGFVDRHRNDELMNRLEAARNNFFERKRKHQEDYEKDMLQNLDLKMELVAKAEALSGSENWKEGSETFRQLMDEWKGIGRTMHEKNEELWNRFIQAKNNFFERKKVHTDLIQAEQENNYLLKLALTEKAEALKESTAWTKTTEAFAILQEEWKKVGYVPREKSDELWNRWNAAKDHFFQNKRQHHEVIRVTHEDNYAQKIALVKRANELKHSNNWRDATEEMNELMDEWKKIGPVPREHSNALWDQFIAARKFFFARKDEERDRRKQHAEKQIQFKHQKTRSFLDQLESELKEEQERVADFKIALENITPGNKEEELRSHLNKLIAESTVKIKHKQEKIEGIKEELAAMDKKATIPGKKEPEAGEPLPDN